MLMIWKFKEMDIDIFLFFYFILTIEEIQLVAIFGGKRNVTLIHVHIS
jgi:hypothetical protein